MPANVPQFDGISAVEAGARLREIRLKQEKTQQELADLCGMPADNYLTGYEKGKKDWRRSDYVVAIMEALRINASMARKQFGMRVVIDPSVSPNHIPEVERPCNANVRFAGVVHAGTGANSATSIDYINVPLSLLGKYRAADCYVVEVTGDSMTDAEAKRSIPEGSHVLLNAKLEPKPRDIVVAWLPEIPGFPDGVGVLKVFRRNSDETTLESINPQGARFPLRAYPDAKIQGVYIAHWQVGRRA